MLETSGMRCGVIWQTWIHVTLFWAVHGHDDLDMIRYTKSNTYMIMRRWLYIHEGRDIQPLKNGKFLPDNLEIMNLKIMHGGIGSILDEYPNELIGRLVVLSCIWRSLLVRGTIRDLLRYLIKRSLVWAQDRSEFTHCRRTQDRVKNFSTFAGEPLQNQHCWMSKKKAAG